MPQFKLSKREARVININRRVEKHGEDDVVAVDIELETHVEKAEMAQLVRVSEGEPLEFIEALFDSSGNARCVNMKAIALEDLGDVSLSIMIDDETIAFASEMKKGKIAVGESLRGGKFSFKVAYTPDEHDEREAALLLYMPATVMLSVKPGAQAELPLENRKDDGGGKARPH